MNFRSILSHPIVYHGFQRAGGFFQARMKAIKMYLPLREGDKIFDIGCGPGFIVEKLPTGINYFGFDTDKKYISYANIKFGDKGSFLCGYFDKDAAEKSGSADVVMMNGVLHHLSDEEADKTLAIIKQVLRPGGRLFTLDGCFVEGQSTLAHKLLKYDRGRYVRTHDGYRSLMTKHFNVVESHIENSLSWVPYTWIVMIARN